MAFLPQLSEAGAVDNVFACSSSPLFIYYSLGTILPSDEVLVQRLFAVANLILHEFLEQSNEYRTS